MRLAGFGLITLFLLQPLQAGEPPDCSPPGSDDKPDAVQAQDKNNAVLDVTPGSPVLKDRDFYDQSGVFHPFVRMPRYVLVDQKKIWTSPFHTSKSDIKWWVLAGGATGALIAVDKHIESNLPRANNTLVSVSNNASNVGSAYTLIPLSAGFYFLGSGTHDEKLRETGLLSFEALIDSAITVEVFKMIADRSRPYQDPKGRFEDNPAGRWGSSFPSGHAISTWALASIVAHEYPHKKLVPLAAYGLAVTVSMARVGARQHFPSDVIAGSAMGWFIGDFVYAKRHNKDLGGRKTVAQSILEHLRIGGDI
jgi:membrane-associated phospholipid phosphatase